MTCVDVERWMMEVMNGEREALPPEAKAHLETCPSCRALWTLHERLSDVPVLRTSLPERQRILEQIRAGGHASTPSVPWWRRPLPAWSLALAAGVVFVLGWAVGHRPGGTVTIPVDPAAWVKLYPLDGENVRPEAFQVVVAPIRAELPRFRLLVNGEDMTGHLVRKDGYFVLPRLPEEETGLVEIVLEWTWEGQTYRMKRLVYVGDMEI